MSTSFWGAEDTTLQCTHNKVGLYRKLGTKTIVTWSGPDSQRSSMFWCRMSTKILQLNLNSQMEVTFVHLARSKEKKEEEPKMAADLFLSSCSDGDEAQVRATLQDGIQDPSNPSDPSQTSDPSAFCRSGQPCKMAAWTSTSRMGRPRGLDLWKLWSSTRTQWQDCC